MFGAKSIAPSSVSIAKLPDGLGGLSAFFTLVLPQGAKGQRTQRFPSVFIFRINSSKRNAEKLPQIQSGPQIGF
jgi:hypothetical protein